MLLRPQLSAFQWDSGLQDIWVLLKRLHAVKSRQPGSCTQPELVRQLSLTICLNPAAAVLGQTSFLCLLADTISDRLWLWFSFGLRVQCSVKILVQPTQRLPSIGERVNACFQFEQYFSCCFVSGPQPLINCSNLLPDCRQLWFVHIKCIQWTSPASLQRGHTSSSSVSVLRLVPSWDCQTHQCSCSLHLQQEKMFNKGSSSPDDRAGTQKYNGACCVSPGIDLPPFSFLAFCISIFTSLPSMAPRCQPSHATAIPKVWEVTIDNVWRLWYFLWELTGFEL